MNPAEWLARTARRRPGATALMRGLAKVSDYQGFARNAAALAAAMQQRLGVEPGDRVALFMPNRTEYLEILYGIWFAGAVAVPINAKLHPREVSWIIENSEAAVAFSDRALGPALGGVAPSSLGALIEVDGADYASLLRAEPMAAPHPMDADDIAWLFYTSGTTGRPKGVMITARNLQAMALTYFVDVDSVHAGDAALYAAPISHGAGLYNFMHVMAGARHVVPESGGFEPGEIAGAAPVLGDVSMFAAPTMVRRLLDHAQRSDWSGEGLRTVVYGGGPMYVADIVEAVETMGPRFVQIYGQGESPMTITALSRDQVSDRSHPRWRERLASVGMAQSCVRVMVVDADGAALPPGEAGEILVKGDPVMRGYWRNAEATAETLEEGWLWTGDVGAMDEDGFLTLHDRSKDVIISAGANIYPREVEEVLLTHASVREAAVVGAPHPEWGEEVVAFVVTRDDTPPDASALDAHCLARIARFKRPRRYLAISELPKNNYGKVVKVALRERLGDADGRADRAR